MKLNSLEEEKNVQIIKETLQRFAVFYNQGDSDEIAKLYHRDGDRVDMNGFLAKGRDKVRQMYEQEISNRPSLALPSEQWIKFEPTSIRLIRSDIAILDGKYSIIQLNGIFTIVLEKEGGVWYVTAGRVLPPRQ